MFDYLVRMFQRRKAAQSLTYNERRRFKVATTRVLRYFRSYGLASSPPRHIREMMQEMRVTRQQLEEALR